MLATLAVLLIAVWVIGLAAHWTGGLIYAALVVGVVLGIAHFLRRRPAM